MQIEVRWEEFSHEWEADIKIGGIVKYVASDDLKKLFEMIYEIAWNFRNNI